MDAGFKQRFRDYVAGAFLAFGIVFLSSEVFTSLFIWTGADVKSIGGDLPGLYICLHLAGGAVGGYLVGRRTRKDILRAGAITSLLAYILEFVYNLLFVGTFENTFYAALGFLVSSVLGAIYANYRMRRQILTSKHQNGREQSKEAINSSGSQDKRGQSEK